MSEQSERERQLAQMQKQALPADADTEAALAQLQALIMRRRKDPEIEARYEQLRDALVDQLKAEGPRYYLDEEGNKRYAYVVQPEPVEVDMDELLALYEAGELPQSLMDKIAPRKVDKEALRRAVSKGQITRAQFTKVAKLVKGTAHVSFSDPVE